MPCNLQPSGVFMDGLCLHIFGGVGFHYCEFVEADGVGASPEGIGGHNGHLVLQGGEQAAVLDVTPVFGEGVSLTVELRGAVFNSDVEIVGDISRTWQMPAAVEGGRVIIGPAHQHQLLRRISHFQDGLVPEFPRGPSKT